MLRFAQHDKTAEVFLDKPYYQQSYAAYSFFHSNTGAIHMALNFDGKFDPDGYYGQVRLVHEQVQQVRPSTVLELASGRGFDSAKAFFQVPALGRLLARLFPPHLLKNAVAGLLMPYSVSVGAQGYFSITLEKDSPPDTFWLKRECDWDRPIMVEQIIQETQAQLEQTEITAVAPMNAGLPLVALSQGAQVDDPQVSQAGGQHQPRDPFGVTQVTAVQLKAPAFRVGKEGFDPHLLRSWGRCVHAFAIPVTGSLHAGQDADQVDRLGVAGRPPGNHPHRAVGGLGEQDAFAKGPFPAATFESSRLDHFPSSLIWMFLAVRQT
ncbi:MAG TPA: hypothetical protein VIK33_16215 [Anaerolineae bacterium]